MLLFDPIDLECRPVLKDLTFCWSPASVWSSNLKFSHFIDLTFTGLSGDVPHAYLAKNKWKIDLIISHYCACLVIPKAKTKRPSLLGDYYCCGTLSCTSFRVWCVRVGVHRWVSAMDRLFNVKTVGTTFGCQIQCNTLSCGAEPWPPLRVCKYANILSRNLSSEFIIASFRQSLSLVCSHES